jgi:hypothetical protein
MMSSKQLESQSLSGITDAQVRASLLKPKFLRLVAEPKELVFIVLLAKGPQNSTSFSSSEDDALSLKNCLRLYCSSRSA